MAATLVPITSSRCSTGPTSSTIGLALHELQSYGPVVAANLELGHVVFEAVEDIVQLGGLGDGLDLKPGIEQGGVHQLGGCGDPAVEIGEQVHVLGGTGADAVGDEGLAAGEGEAVSAGHGERDTGDLVLERVRRG
ncbi:MULTISPECIES: hypothetical protein [Micromonospora]|uniref:hypothetical protein n=1 Tax=Micromonospora TaxID=1873 RepID=UPI002100D3B8|nr:hypothetical protein [Micromonospora sp. II]